MAGRRLSPSAIDAAVAIAACVAAELELALSSGIQGSPWVNAVAAAGATLPIAVRRRWPHGGRHHGGGSGRHSGGPRRRPHRELDHAAARASDGRLWGLCVLRA